MDWPGSQPPLEKVPPADEPADVAVSVNEMIDKLVNLYFRVMAHLAVVAERVETAVGLPPLPEPPKPRDEEEERDALGIQ